MYKAGTITKDERNQKAIDLAFAIVKETNLIPENYLEIIKGIIESHVSKQ